MQPCHLVLSLEGSAAGTRCLTASPVVHRDPRTFTPEPTVPVGCSQAVSKPNLFCPTWDSSNRQHLIEVSHWLGQNILTTALQGETLPSSLPCSLSPCLGAVSSCSLVPPQSSPLRSLAHLFLPCCLLLQGPKLASKDTPNNEHL